jgi:hypothetical protein
MDEENGMSGIDVAAIERIVANTINETARGDPDALAARIVAAVAEGPCSTSPSAGLSRLHERPRRRRSDFRFRCYAL